MRDDPGPSLFMVDNTEVPAKYASAAQPGDEEQESSATFERAGQKEGFENEYSFAADKKHDSLVAEELEAGEKRVSSELKFEQESVTNATVGSSNNDEPTMTSQNGGQEDIRVASQSAAAKSKKAKNIANRDL